MTKQTLKNQLYEVLKNKMVYIHGAELEDYGRSLGYSASNVSRRLRDLRAEGKIESELRVHEGTKIAYWKIKEQPAPFQFKREINPQMTLKI